MLQQRTLFALAHAAGCLLSPETAGLHDLIIADSIARPHAPQRIRMSQPDDKGFKEYEI